MKLLKFIIFFVLLIYTSFVFDQTEVSLSVDKNKIDINEQIKVVVEIKIDENDDNSDLIINGLENFDVLNQSRMQNISIVNGVQTGGISFVFILQAKQKGVYKLDIAGKEQTIEVTGYKVLVGTNDDLMSYTEKEHNSLEKQRSSSGSLEQENKKEEIEKKEEKIIGIEGEEMKDIYDIKEQKNVLPFNILFSIFYIIFVIFAYILYKKYMLYKNTKKEVIPIKKPNPIDYNKLILSIEKDFLDDKKEVFYGNLGKFLRLYIDDKVEMGLSSKTLNEIKPYLKYDIYKIFERVYFPEYDNKEDSKEQRLEILSLIKDKLGI